MISHFVRSADSPRFLSDGKPIVSDERLPLLRATCNWIVDFAMLLANQALEFARLHRQAQRSTAPSDAASNKTMDNIAAAIKTAGKVAITSVTVS